MSEVIWEFAADIIRTGNSPEERQSILNAVCNAWSIACNPPEMRGPNLDYYVREFQRFNPGAAEKKIAFVRGNMETLIDRKLETFPTDLRQIVGARIVKSGDKDHLEITSARMQ
ncbi:MAG: hypothetical protein ACYC3X_30780 [Pirellulaceae bacterium]